MSSAPSINADATTLTVRVPIVLKHNVERMCRSAGRTLASVVRDALFSYMTGAGRLCSCVHTLVQHEGSKGRCLIATCTCKAVVEIGWR